MMKGVMGQQISYLTVIVVHSTVHLMHHNHCQITTICMCFVYTHTNMYTVTVRNIVCIHDTLCYKIVFVCIYT